MCVVRLHTRDDAANLVELLQSHPRRLAHCDRGDRNRAEFEFTCVRQLSGPQLSHTVLRWSCLATSAAGFSESYFHGIKALSTAVRAMTDMEGSACRAGQCRFQCASFSQNHTFGSNVFAKSVLAHKTRVATCSSFEAVPDTDSAGPHCAHYAHMRQQCCSCAESCTGLLRLRWVAVQRQVRARADTSP